MNSPLRILIIGDKIQAEDAIASVLDSSALDPICLPDIRECTSYLERPASILPGLVLLNPDQPDAMSLDLLRPLRAQHPHLLLAITGFVFTPAFIADASQPGVLLLRNPISPQDIEGRITRTRLEAPPSPPD